MLCSDAGEPILQLAAQLEPSPWALCHVGCGRQTITIDARRNELRTFRTADPQIRSVEGGFLQASY